MNSVLYRAWPRSRDFEKSEIEKVLAMNVIEPAQTEWVSLVFFAQNKNETMWLCKNQRELIALNICD